LSRGTLRGRFDRTIGNETAVPAFRRSLCRTFFTPRRISALVELPSRAARDFSWRYIPSGISTVVRMCSLCHIYGVERRSTLTVDALTRSLSWLPTSISRGCQHQSTSSRFQNAVEDHVVLELASACAFQIFVNPLEMARRTGRFPQLADS
jgi:hypothetical protein